MKRLYIFMVCVLYAISAFADINFIDISKITHDEKFVAAFNNIKDNQKYYDHWTYDWDYETPKEDFIKNLSDDYTMFSSLTNKSEELYLLLGDIAHYLYNLNDTIYYNVAVNNYTLAIKSTPKDYRSYWFLGYHYALSNVPTKAIDNFLKAQSLLPAEQSGDFWEDYAWATAVASMPSHCIFAMDKVKSITGKEWSPEAELGQSIRNNIIQLNRDSSYDKRDIWSANEGKKVTFTSRSLGIKLLIDSAWNVSVYDYANHQSAFIVSPPPIANKEDREISYTIAVIIKTADEKDKLDDYINKFVSKYSNKTRIDFSKKYDKMIAYEIKDKTMYQDMGGGHMYMIGIARNAPEYPGLLLENPVNLPSGKVGELTYYTTPDVKKRFEGKIFYLIMLDSCEDIHEQSLSIFKTLFDNQIIIE